MANGHKAIKPSARLGLSSTPSMSGNEGNSETFVKGAILIDDGAGLLDEAGANPQDLIVGVAEEDANNNTSNAVIRFVPALPHVLFEGTLDTSAAAGTGVSAQTDLWAKYGVTEDADGIWYVDKNKSTEDTNTVVVVTKIYGTIGDTTPQVQFMFIPTVTAFTATRT